MKNLLNLLCMAAIAGMLVHACVLFPSDSHGQEAEESYIQCRTGVLNEISEAEARTGKKVSYKNKTLSVQVYCSGKPDSPKNVRKRYDDMWMER